MAVALIALYIAYIFDIVLGDPVYPLHPVRLIGHLIKIIETGLSKIGLRNLLGGFLLFLICQLVVIGLFTALFVLLIAYLNEPGFITSVICCFLIYSTMTIKDLSHHGKRVRIALKENNLEEARAAVQMIIGRDANQLDSHGVARATVESLAESFVDGFLAPIFWFCVGCLISLIALFPPVIGGTIVVLFYRVTNTLDSMVGYKNEQYRTFGTFSARLDDALNYIPARLSIFIITLASMICHYDFRSAWKTAWRDRLKHSSPNAAHAEAAVAGALNVKLNGPGVYPHGVVEKPWIGDGSTELTSAQIRRASRLVMVSSLLSILFTLLLAITL